MDRSTTPSPPPGQAAMRASKATQTPPRMARRSSTTTITIRNSTLRFAYNLLVLFAVGSLLSLLVDSLQRSHEITKWPSPSPLSSSSTAGAGAGAGLGGSASVGAGIAVHTASDGQASGHRGHRGHRGHELGHGPSHGSAAQPSSNPNPSSSSRSSGSSSNSNSDTAAASGSQPRPQLLQPPQPQPPASPLSSTAGLGAALPLLSSAGWVPLSSGLAACLVGTLYPLLDHLLLNPVDAKLLKRTWSSTLRCCGGFIGVSYAASKLSLSNSLQMSLTLALLAVGLWFVFDRTVHGFMVSFAGASVGTFVVLLLVDQGVYSFTQADLWGVRSWFPCILYSSCVCIGAIGRQLSY
ncbi:insulin-induced protein-domain-containing protein [Entophlyctis helioformis]|nr:insulin-induced protein-domain-containing protein [Entophlyctis helioformis]